MNTTSVDEVRSRVETRSLSDGHLDQLASKWAISPETIIPTGSYSAYEPEDLPESLRYRANELPGVCFALTKGDGTTVWQFRPDNPLDEKKKYGQEPGSGAVITLHPVMRERLERCRADGTRYHLVAVEGTKQYLVAVENGPEQFALKDGDELLPVIAVGVQGCGNWTDEGAPLGELDEYLDGAASLTVIFDGDRKTNYWVWQAGSRLKDHAEILGVTTVRFCEVAGGKKADLDGVLAKRAAGEPRRRYLLGLMKKATENMGRCPAKPKPSAAKRMPVGRIEWAEGRIYAASTIQEVNGTEVEVPSSEPLADFAARIVRTIQIIDDLKQGDVDLEHDLEGRIAGRDETFAIPGVPDALIRDVAYWRNRMGRGEASRRFSDSSDAGVRLIEQTIRTYEEDATTYVQAFKRTGWVLCNDGEWRYLTPLGAIGANGTTPNAVSRLDHHTYQANIRIPDPSEHTTEEHAVALREFLLIGPDRLSDPTAWYATVGSQCYAQTGAAPRTGLLIAGKHGSGKTVITQTAASWLGPAFHALGGIIMGSFNGTGNAVGDAGKGLHHCFVTVDDLRHRKSPRRQEEQDTACEDLIRKTYEGGSVGRARNRVNRQNGKVVTDQPDASCPLVIFTGEYVPSAEAVGSSVERLLSIKVAKNDTMKPGQSEQLKTIGRSGRPAVACSGWLRHLASHINEAGGLPEFVETVEKRRVEVQDRLRREEKSLSERAAEVAAPALVGWSLLVEYGVSIGALDKPEAKELLVDAARRLTRAAIRHSAVELADDLTPCERMLAQCRSLVASGKARLDGDLGHGDVIAKHDTTTVLRDRNDPDSGTENVPTVVINPDAVAALLGPGVTGVRVIDALKEKAEPRPSGGRYGWKKTINRVTITNAIVLRQATWDGDDV